MVTKPTNPPKSPLTKRAPDAVIVGTSEPRSHNKILQPICVLGSLVAVGYFGGVQQNVEMMTVAMVAVVIFFVVLQFDQIDKLKAFKGLFEMEGAVRNAKAVTEEARATVEQLRSVGLTLAEPSLRLIATSGRWGAPIPVSERIEITTNLVDALRLAGCSEVQLKKVRQEVDKVTLWDLARRVFQSALKFLNNNKDFNNRSRELQGYETGSGSFRKGAEYSTPTPKQMKALLDEFKVEDAETLRLFREYQVFYDEVIS